MIRRCQGFVDSQLSASSSQSDVKMEGVEEEEEDDDMEELSLIEELQPACWTCSVATTQPTSSFRT